MNEPKHVRGICDIADCDCVASRAYRDEEANIYLEICADHASSLGGFDSDYERVEHDSPHREPERVESHDCGGELRVYSVGEDGEEDEGVHRVCARCGYAVLVRHTGEKTMRVKEAPPEEMETG